MSPECEHLIETLTPHERSLFDIVCAQLPDHAVSIDLNRPTHKMSLDILASHPFILNLGLFFLYRPIQWPGTVSVKLTKLGRELSQEISKANAVTQELSNAE